MSDQLQIVACDRCKESGCCPDPVVGSSTTGKGKVCKGHNEAEWGRALRSYDPSLSAGLLRASKVSLGGVGRNG